MPNYTKLFNSIVTSTIWTEDDKTRLVWITMLAISDQNGEVHASIPGLARVAGVGVQDTMKAIECLLSPDKFSRTKDFEGRRIAEIDGGWELLNHAKYRKMASKEDAKAANAERQRRHRERNASVTLRNGSVTPRNASVTQTRDIAEAEAEADTDTHTEGVPPKPPKGGRVSLSQMLDLIETGNPYAESAEKWAEYKSQLPLRDSYRSEKSWLANLRRMKRYPVNVVANAVERAISNGWKGWEQDSVLEHAFTEADKPAPQKIPEWSKHPNFKEAAAVVLGEQFDGTWEDFPRIRLTELKAELESVTA